MLLRCCHTEILFHLLYLCPCLDLGLFLPYLSNLFFFLRCRLPFALFFASFSLMLLIKVLLIEIKMCIVFSYFLLTYAILSSGKSTEKNIFCLVLNESY